jgi:hypothetical protein
MNEAIAACISYPLIVGLTLCYVAGVPTSAQLIQFSQALLKPLLGCFHLITRVF